MEPIFKTREEWLRFVAEGMRPVFKRWEVKLPDKYRITMSMISGKTTIGRCYSPESSADGTYEILIRLDQVDPMEVASVLAHELIHAAVGLEHKHTGEFKRVALDMGFVGKMTHSVPGELFKAAIKPILERAGPFPHARLDWSKHSGPPKQTTRMKKTECSVCGYTVRLSEKWLSVGIPECPVDRVKMVSA